jgi:hypothetical protein
MSQQPDQLPSSYWQFDPASEQDVQGESGAGSSGSTPVVVASTVQRGDKSGAWQTPAASSLPSAMPPQAPSPLPPQPGRPRRRHSLLRILALLLVVVLLGVAGSASGFQLNRLVNQRGQAGASPTANLGQVPTAPPRVTPAATPTKLPPASPQPSPTNAVPTPTPQAVILAQDDFQRPNRDLWGNASDGSAWGGDANTAPVFSIVAGTGRVTGGAGFFNALLGPRAANAEVVYSGSVSHFDNLRDNLGAVLRFSDNDNYYKAYFDGAQLILIKRVAGVVTRLGAVPFPAQDGVSYSLRFRAVGSHLLVRAWPTGGTEPGSWMIAASDSALAAGFSGLRVLVEPGITITVAMFQERSIA